MLSLGEWGSSGGFLPSYGAAGETLLECCQTRVSALQKDTETEKIKKKKKKLQKLIKGWKKYQIVRH